jgi:hypothetical protein
MTKLTSIDFGSLDAVCGGAMRGSTSIGLPKGGQVRIGAFNFRASPGVLKIEFTKSGAATIKTMPFAR